MRRPLLPTLAGLALLASAAPARAEEPPLPVPPSYSPADHGGLPYPVYLRMSRGTARRSTGMMVGGIIITAVGAAAQATGLGVYASDRCSDFAPTPDGLSVCVQPRNQRVTGLAFMLAGTIAVAVGIPLWVIGQAQAPWAEADGRAAAPRWARILPEIAPTGRGAELRFRF
jgi:hypothetical protein